MKSIYALLFALALVAAQAESTNAPPINTGPLNYLDPWLVTDVIGHVQETPLLTLETKPNELRLGKITLSGIAIEAFKVENPLELINPWAPPEYGESQDNATFSLMTNRATGWKFFAFEF